MTKRKREVKEKDLISKLPDEVLSLIVSHLPLREAVRTCIISKRWRHVWKFVSKLEFDAVNIAQNASHFRNLTNHNQVKFVELVNQVLQLHQSGRIESFKLQCSLGLEYSSQLDRWLQLVIKRTLEKLDIDTFFSHRSHSTPSENCYRIPSWVFDGRLPALKHLSLAHCSFELPSSATCFSSLVSLTLASTHLSQDNINVILSGSPYLQSVSLVRCICPSHLELASRNQFLSLKHIAIFKCKYLRELSIFDAVRLLSFECLRTSLSLLNLQNTAKAVRLYLDIGYASFLSPWQNYDRFAAHFPKLEKLMLILPGMESEGDLIPQIQHQLPTFHSLQELKLDCSLQFSCNVLQIVDLWLKASPNLQKLQLIQPPHPHLGVEIYALSPYIRSNDYYSLHENLRDVALHNVNGELGGLILLVYLLKNATPLEKVRIHRNSRTYKGNGRWSKVTTSCISRKKLHRRIRKLVSELCLTKNTHVLVF